MTMIFTGMTLAAQKRKKQLTANTDAKTEYVRVAPPNVPERNAETTAVEAPAVPVISTKNA